MQEELENRSVVLATRATKMTAQTLAKLMRTALRKTNEAHYTPKAGRQSMKQLSKGGELSNVEITSNNIKAFDPYARKYNVGYSLKKDATTDPLRWLVFFRSKSLDSMNAAFSEFTARMIKRERDKPSIHETMREHRDIDRNKVRERTRGRDRGPEL
ncbi:MAG: PcfB family protein [Oscillospiraceae bacterium]|nr:PcfB family protein [Oscillospiraceae bacterium]